MQLYDDISVSENENSEIEITGTIPRETAAHYRTKAVQELGKHAEVPGFRKGHVPEDVLEKHIGSEKILYETAQKALSDAYPQVVTDQNLSVLGQPQVTLTKLADGEPIGFKITTAVMPSIELPDYKQIAADEARSERGPVSVEEDEVENVIREIRKSKKAGQQDTNATEQQGETAHSEDGDDLPEFTDEMAQSLGEFESVADFKEKLRENIKQEKEKKEDEKRRVAIGDKLVEGARMGLPSVLADYELDKMMAQFKNDISQAGMAFDDYLKQMEKSEDNLRGEWRDTAEKRAKLQLILNKIATEEGITPSEEEVKQQVEYLHGQYPDADPQNIQTYVETVLTNERVFQFLESHGSTTESEAATETTPSEDTES